MENTELFKTAEEFLKYFNAELEKINISYNKCEEMEQIINKHITAIDNAPAGKGTQHYLIEHTANMISIQTEKQSLVKEITSLKQKAIEFAMKITNKEESLSDHEAIMLALDKLIEKEKKMSFTQSKPAPQDDATLDDEIQRRLQKPNKKEED